MGEKTSFVQSNALAHGAPGRRIEGRVITLIGVRCITRSGPSGLSYLAALGSSAEATDDGVLH